MDEEEKIPSYRSLSFTLHITRFFFTQSLSTAAAALSITFSSAFHIKKILSVTHNSATLPSSTTKK